MDTYFFVPGNRINKIEDIEALGVTQIIIDLEDAVKFSERESILKVFKNNNLLQKYFIRIPLFNEKGILDFYFLKKLVDFGYSNFVFPKLNEFDQVSQVFNSIGTANIKVLLLIETPRLFLEAKDILLSFRKYIFAIGMGSHDFMSEIGGEHTLKNLEVVRLQLLYLARMCSMEAIDIASMELIDEKSFKDEIIDGFMKGYDAKFFIHPWQLNVFKGLSLYTEKDYFWATKILETLKEVGNVDEFNPVIIDGQVIERPHLNKAKKIIKYYKS